MTVFTSSYVPYEFNTKNETLRYITECCYNIKRSLKFVLMDTEHLEVRCPVSGEYLEITGSTEEVAWLHNELVTRNWYKPFI